MKQIKCEMCGSTELVKVDGLFVCQGCGCKYSPEEAKKLMSDDETPTTNTVKIDASDFIEKQLINARRAKEKEDWIETEKYYNIVEKEDPYSIEALFYSSYGKARQTLVDIDFFKREESFKVLAKTITLISDSYKVDNEENLKPVLEQIYEDLVKLLCANFVWDTIGRPDNLYENDRLKTERLFREVCDVYVKTLIQLASMISDNAKKTFYFELAIKMVSAIITYGRAKDNSPFNSEFMTLHNQLKEIDPSHVVPSSAPQAPSGGGCYVATAVYGSYDCPQVWTLRRYRDYSLAKTWYGRLFIYTYYAISPTLVKWFGETEWFKNMWKPKLDKMVGRLNAEGVEDTPYQDKIW